MRTTLPLLLATVLVAAGCATRTRLIPRSLMPLSEEEKLELSRAGSPRGAQFPSQYRAVQRAIVTVRGRQFTCDGLLTVSPTEGHHLALVSSFGVVTDLLIQPDGDLELLKVTPLFREDWSRDFVARDLRCLFVPPEHLQPAGKLADGRRVFSCEFDDEGTLARYIFDVDHWQELELERNGRTLYRARVKSRRTFSPEGVEVPDAFEVLAESYRLDLRVATMTTEGPR